MNVCMAIAALTAFGFVEVTAPPTTAWRNDYRIAVQAARLAQRPLLIVIENPNETDQRLDGIDDEARFADLLSSYELCRVDVTTEYGKKVAQSYGATQFPYTAITDNSCRSVVFRGAGKFSPDIWERTLNRYRDTRALSHSFEGAVGDGSLPAKTASQVFAHATLAAATAASKRSGRPMLIFVTMPGCYHCVRMKSETYRDGPLRMRITRDFESVVVDQTEEPDWVHDKDVTLFPTTLILSHDGEVLSRMPGYVSAHDLASRLESISGQSLSQL